MGLMGQKGLRAHAKIVCAIINIKGTRGEGFGIASIGEVKKRLTAILCVIRYLVLGSGRFEPRGTLPGAGS
jgi:hypothetical protein